MTTFNGTDITGGTIHGQDITEMTVHGNVVFSGSGGGGSSSTFHLNAQDSGDHVDLSSNSVTLSDGQTFLCWMRIYQLGSTSAAHYPGIFGNASGGDWNDFFEFYSDSGTGAITSGNPQARFACENAAGSWINTDPFTVDLDNNPWQLVGLTAHTDGTYTFWRNNGTESVNANNATSGSTWNINFLGYSYAGDDDGGSGGKDIDTAGLWDRELTASEVTGFYDSAAIPDSPMHLWEFDDDTSTTAVDSAGAADGTVNGATYISGGAY